MSSDKSAVPGAAEGAREGRRGQGRRSARREVTVVLEFLRGEGLENLSRKYAVTAPPRRRLARRLPR